MTAKRVVTRYHDRYGECQWLDAATDPCDYIGGLRRGLCPRHYFRLRSAVIASGMRVDDMPTPMRCTCGPTEPVMPVRIIDGSVLISDAYQCRHCGRYVPTEQVVR